MHFHSESDIISHSKTAEGVNAVELYNVSCCVVFRDTRARVLGTAVIDHKHTVDV